jgi:hypothetical protein
VYGLASFHPGRRFEASSSAAAAPSRRRSSPGLGAVRLEPPFVDSPDQAPDKAPSPRAPTFGET